MSLISKSEFLENAFSAQKLVDFAQDDNLPAISPEEFCGLVNTALFDFGIPLLSQRENLSREIQGKYSIPNKIINYCLLVDLLFESLQSKACFHSDLTELHLSLKPVILKALICDPKFLHSDQHFLRELLDYYFSYAAAWHPNLGTSGKQLFSRFRHLISSLQAMNGNEKSFPENIAKSLETLKKLFEHFRSLEAKLCQNERVHMNERLAARVIDQFLDESLKNKPLPSSIIEFLQGPWRKVLIQYNTTANEPTKQLEKLQSFTLDTIHTFCLNESGQHATDKTAHIPTIKPTIEKYLGKEANSDSIRNYLSAIEKLNYKILQAESYPTELAAPLLEENNQLFAQVGQGILQASANLKIGQILAFEREPHVYRCRIADIYFNDTKEFLFVSLIGEKVGTKSFVGLGYELVAKNCLLIDPDRIFKKHFIAGLELILRRYDQLRKKNEQDKEERKQLELRKIALEKARKEAEELRMQKDRMEKQYQEDAERQRRLQEEMEKRIKQEIEEKYRAEAEKLRQQNSHLSLQLEEEAKKNAVHETIQKVEALTIGSWLNAENKSGEMEPCKVGMIYPSNKKIVLVNRTGVRVGEYLPSELVQQIINGKASILKQENSFEHSMEKVINSLKR